MSKRTTDHSLQEKIEAVVDVIDKKHSMNHIAKERQVSFHTLQS